MFALTFGLLPKQVAFQDLGALLAHQPGVARRAHEFILESPFGTIHAATFNLPRPLGTAIPHPPIYALANFDPTDIARSIGALWLGDPTAPQQFPAVNRKDKRDSLLHRKRAPLPPLPPLLAIKPVPAAEADTSLKPEETAADRIDPYTVYEFTGLPGDKTDSTSASTHTATAPVKVATLPENAEARETTEIYFGSDPLASDAETLKPYAPGEAPVVNGAPDLTLAALDPAEVKDSDKGGESIAKKGEVTGVGQRPMSPAERLRLSGKAQKRAERCLANAVYFEARSEPVRGQIAVAQVVINRVFSPFYPDNVCDVVYQNANHHLACQFTFACDGIPDVVTEPDAWARAKRIAKDMLDGKLWLPQVAKSTHYHAYWVHPDWVAEMKKIYHIGAHTFYRPRAWGNGAGEPSFSNPATTARETRIIKRM